MDDVIAATGWSSSAVYRYARSKDELIEAATRESLSQFDAMVTGLLVPGLVLDLAQLGGASAQAVLRAARVLSG